NRAGAGGVNRFGGRDDFDAQAMEFSYGDHLIEVSAGQPPYFDREFGRDPAGQGRPMKRIDTYGRSLTDGVRVYRPGDRVTPMEWRAYGSMLPVNLLREYQMASRYDETRQYLGSKDLLVG